MLDSRGIFLKHFAEEKNLWSIYFKEITKANVKGNSHLFNKVKCACVL